MPTVEHSAVVAATPTEVWAFVRNMDNWAPFLTGYQKHNKLSEEESRWFLKGELGGLTRVAEFNVKILQWNEPYNVTFELSGINEPVTGAGEFAVSGGVPEPVPVVTSGFFKRSMESFTRWLIDHIFKSQKVAASQTVAGPQTTTLRFAVTVTARGMSGPILNVLLAPMLKPVAEDLANKIAEAISGRPAYAD